MFRYIVFLVVFIPGSLIAGAQVEEPDEPMRTDIVSLPVFPGGHAAIEKISFPFMMEIFFIPNQKFEEISRLEKKIPAMAVRVYGYKP